MNKFGKRCSFLIVGLFSAVVYYNGVNKVESSLEISKDYSEIDSVKGKILYLEDKKNKYLNETNKWYGNYTYLKYLRELKNYDTLSLSLTIPLAERFYNESKSDLEQCNLIIENYKKGLAGLETTISEKKRKAFYSWFYYLLKIKKEIKQDHNEDHTKDDKV